eukprot:COSAG02_NODE_60108_length_272_cov_0.601156_2_plen_50_part_01
MLASVVPCAALATAAAELTSRTAPTDRIAVRRPAGPSLRREGASACGGAR